MHGKRLLSAAFLLGFFLLVIVYGGEGGFALVMMGVAVIGLWEFTRLGDHAPGAWRGLALAGGVVLVGATYLGGVEWFALSVVLLLFLYLGRVVAGTGEIEGDLRRATLCFLGVAYVAGPISLAVALRAMPEGVQYLLLGCGIVWAGDTAAFYAGTGFGRHPLALRVSPRKSVEGCVGGLVASIAASWALATALRMVPPPVSSLLLGAVIGGAGQMGDLVESMIKRAFQVKDAGRLIPGHGGMLDRIDSLLFAIPVFYLWVRLGWI